MTTATATPTLDERITTRRTTLQKQRAERLDPLDYPRTWTQRQVNVYDAETATNRQADRGSQRQGERAGGAAHPRR